MQSTKGLNIGDVSTAKAATPGLPKNGNAPAFGKALGSIVPEGDQEAFQAFASRRPRIMALLRNPELADIEKEEISAAYKAFQDEKKKTAMVKAQAPTVAPKLGISEEEAEVLLETYKPEQLTSLALIAQEQGLEPKDVVRVDAALLEDGSFIRRAEETLTVSSVHGALQKLLNDAIAGSAGRRAVQAQDTNLDNIWESLLKECEGDEVKAAAAYAQRAQDVLLNAKAGVKPSTFELPTDSVVELFKLFNYDREEIYAFLHYAEENFYLPPLDSPVKIEQVLFGELLQDYVREKAGELVLNERSRLYSAARATELGVLLEEGKIGGGALMEIEAAPQEAPATEASSEDEEDEADSEGPDSEGKPALGEDAKGEDGG